MGLDDFLDKFNLISRVQGAVWSLGTYLPHRKTHKGRAVGPWLVDGGTRQISVDRAYTTGGMAERILQRVNIPIAGRRITDREAIFTVKARQAQWAEYALLRGGAVLGPTHRIIDPRNVAWAGKYTTAVPAWASDAQPHPPEEAERSAPQPGERTNTHTTESRARRALRELW